MIDGTFGDLQAAVHLRVGSAIIDGSAVVTAEARKRAHYARPEHVSFGERSYKIATLRVESFVRPDESGAELSEKIATSVVGRSD